MCLSPCQRFDTDNLKKLSRCLLYVRGNDNYSLPSSHQHDNPSEKALRKGTTLNRLAGGTFSTIRKSVAAFCVGSQCLQREPLIWRCSSVSDCATRRERDVSSTKNIVHRKSPLTESFGDRGEEIRALSESVSLATRRKLTLTSWVPSETKLVEISAASKSDVQRQTLLPSHLYWN